MLAARAAAGRAGGGRRSCRGSSRPYVAQAGSAAGRPAPTALNRAGGKSRDRGGLPRGRRGVGGGRRRSCGLALPCPAGEVVVGARQPGARLVVAGKAASASAGGVQRPPEAATGSQPASWTVM